MERKIAMALLNEVFSPRIYDRWEVLPGEERATAIRESLAEYIGFAREKVPYYRERCEAFDGDAEFPLKDVPSLTSSELRALLPPKSSELVTETGCAVNVFQSGGTTGAPKTALFSHHEMELLTMPNARGFYALGLRKEDRVANLFAVGGLYMTFVHINRMLQQYGCTNFPFSNQTGADFIHSVTRLFSINVFTGISSSVLDCLRKMMTMDLDGIAIEKVFYGGEHLYDADRAELKERLGVSLIAAPGYGTVDTWYIGYQCLQCPPGVFHLHDDQCYTEIVNGDTGENCRPGVTGMLYATPIVRRLTPIIRYQVGDRAYWMEEPCPCGRTTPRFKLLGRGDDVLRIGYDSIDYAFVQQAAAAVGRITGAIQMEKRRKEGKDLLIIRMETEAPAAEHRRLGEAFEAQILEGRPSLRGFIEKNTVWPLEIEVSGPGALARSERTGKLRRVIDVIE
jgi:phenylacetate-coenzyme A ligase PaaK-like adenylate-forming protein